MTLKETTRIQAAPGLLGHLVICLCLSLQNFSLQIFKLCGTYSIQLRAWDAGTIGSLDVHCTMATSQSHGLGKSPQEATIPPMATSSTPLQQK